MITQSYANQYMVQVRPINVMFDSWIKTGNSIAPVTTGSSIVTTNIVTQLKSQANITGHRM